MNHKFILIFLLVFCFSFTSLTFSNDIKIQTVINTGKVNLSIAQDKDGLFWIGTAGGGLLCYNGNKVRRIKISESKGLFQIVLSVFVDSEGIIWAFIQGQGLFSCDKNIGIWKRYKAGDKKTNSLTSDNACWSANFIAEDGEGLIWVGTDNGLNAYNKKTGIFSQFRHDLHNPNSLSNNSVLTVCVDREGLVWIGTEDGLNIYNKKTNNFCYYKHDSGKLNSVSDNSIRAIVEDKDGNLWIGTKGAGIDKFDRKSGKFTNFSHNPNVKNSLPCNEIHHLMVDRNNNLWICNEGNIGIAVYNIATSTFKNYGHSIYSFDSIGLLESTFSFEDNAGTIWLPDNNGDINKCTFRKNIFKKYSYVPKNPHSLISNNLSSLHEDKNKRIWIGSFKSGMCLYVDGDTFKKFVHVDDNPSSLPGNAVYSITDAPSNKLWVGNSKGYISLFDPDKECIVKNFQNPYLKDTPCSLTVDNKNPELLWFASYFSGGLFKLNTMTGEFSKYKYGSADTYSLNSEGTLHILQDGNFLWLGTNGNGLIKFDKNTGKSIQFKYNPDNKNSISGNIVVESFIDSKGNFWLTTDDGGLNKFNKQTEEFTHYGIDSRFPSNSTRHILEDKEGYLWISMDFGIVKFSPKTLKVVKQFTTTDGLPSNQFDRLANPLNDASGNFWFSTLKGLCKFNPEEASRIKANSNMPPIVLSSFKSKEGTYNEYGIKKLTDIQLPWPDNSFEFTFAALDYVDQEQNQYAYKLEGFDRDWKYIGTDRFGQYSNLPPGEYILHLKGSNNDGVWNEEGISIKITITPPFWMMLWFKMLAVILVFIIILGVFHIRMISLKKRAAFLEEYNARLNDEINERKRVEEERINTDIELRKTTAALHKVELETAKEHAIATMAGQVAHDIRSPLLSLSMISKTLSELPENKRILIRNATQRINDIANNLSQYNEVEGNDIIEEVYHQELEPELLAVLMDSLASEKRIQMERQDIDFIVDIKNDAYSNFVRLDPHRFKRMLSNLINNSVNALPQSGGIIRLTLERDSDMLVIKLIDNGKGIQTNILSELKKCAGIRKEGELGLGISSAIQNIKDWNGYYDILSTEGAGTTFIINLPIAEAPDWFQDKISIKHGQKVVALDDDASIHDVWETLFQKYLTSDKIALYNFRTALDFSEYCRNLASPTDLFLIDYEFLDSEETGLDLIEKFNIQDQVILVTSHYEESEIIRRVKDMGIKIIPKNFAPYIPIKLEENSK